MTDRLPWNERSFDAKFKQFFIEAKKLIRRAGRQDAVGDRRQSSWTQSQTATSVWAWRHHRGHRATANGREAAAFSRGTVAAPGEPASGVDVPTRSRSFKARSTTSLNDRPAGNASSITSQCNYPYLLLAARTFNCNFVLPRCQNNIYKISFLNKCLFSIV